ncbi:MAG: hypothetical protein NTX50_03210 [Candidatus Sumerlaeota bacterium]|nr:hypothetical protein [Candidatus Sumerlaeota bacterium]
MPDKQITSSFSAAGSIASCEPTAKNESAGFHLWVKDENPDDILLLTLLRRIRKEDPGALPSIARDILDEKVVGDVRWEKIGNPTRGGTDVTFRFDLKTHDEPDEESATLSSQAYENKCALCAGPALSMEAFYQAVEQTGLDVNRQTGEVGEGFVASGHPADVDLARTTHREDMETRYRDVEKRKGFVCRDCRSVYCFSCLAEKAPSRPNGGKACPICGGRFDRLT